MVSNVKTSSAHSEHQPFTLRRADWITDRELLRVVRETVFVHEQQVPPEMEWDEDDAASTHALALDGNGRAVGTGRLTPDGRIGRMAVMREWRGHGVGRAILEFLMAEGRRAGLDEIVLNAQVSAIGFYRRFGYIEEGDEFMDAGIPHRRMRYKLNDE